MNQFSSDKILKHLDRVVNWQKTGLSRPITYELDMTNLCDSNCRFCFGFYNRNSDRSSIKFKEVKDIIRQVKEFNGKAITFTGGGEPLCNKDTFEAVKYAKEIGLDVGFITNGIALTKEASAILVDCCTWIRISLDAGTKKFYKITHGLNGKIFNRVLKNISFLVKTKKQKKSKITIGTGFLTFSEVKEDMKAFVRISKNLGVDYAQFRPLLKRFNEKEINKIADSGISENLKACLKMSDNNFDVLFSVHKYESMKNGKTKRGYKKCYGHYFATVIAADKKMYLCCHVRGMDKYCIGNLSKNSLPEIWKSEQRKKVYKNISFKDCPLLCRCDGFNNILWNICQKKNHPNFL